MQEKYGDWAFLLGVLIALIVGVFASQLGPHQPLALALLAVLGLVVGFLNVREKEVNSFLIAAIALLMVSGGTMLALAPVLELEGFEVLQAPIAGFLSALAVFVAPATLIVALLAIYRLAYRK